MNFLIGFGAGLVVALVVYLYRKTIEAELKAELEKLKSKAVNEVTGKKN
jgi:capsular polysaccharide biosynthesis protein